MMRIFSGVFLKEFVKTRSCMLILFAGNIVFMGWLWLTIRRLFLQDHPEIVWYRVMDLGQSPWTPLTFVPILCGVLFCVFQFWPEMRDERMRISLHLPCPIASLILAHLIYGLGFLAVLFTLDSAALSLMLAQFFPAETQRLAVSTCLPWFMAGLYAYLCAAWCILEPQRRVKSVGLILGVCLCVLLTQKGQPGSLVPCLPFFLLGLPLLVAGLLLPAMHYRHRRVQ